MSPWRRRRQITVGEAGLELADGAAVDVEADAGAVGRRRRCEERGGEARAVVWEEQVAPADAAAWLAVPNLGICSTYRPGGLSAEHVDRLAALETWRWSKRRPPDPDGRTASAENVQRNVFGRRASERHWPSRRSVAPCGRARPRRWSWTSWPAISPARVLPS